MSFVVVYVTVCTVGFVALMVLTYPRHNSKGQTYVPWNRLRGYPHYSTPLRPARLRGRNRFIPAGAIAAAAAAVIIYHG
jgi:hypothetical protein